MIMDSFSKHIGKNFPLNILFLQTKAPPQKQSYENSVIDNGIYVIITNVNEGDATKIESAS